jgi:hypothetical protein
MSPHAPTTHPTPRRPITRRSRAAALGTAALVLFGLAASPAIGGPLPDPSVAADGNLIVNPSFENRDRTGRPIGWQIGTDTLPQNVTSVREGNDTDDKRRRSGNAALKLVDPATPGSAMLRSTPVLVTPTVSYTARAYARTLSATSGSKAHLYLEFWDVDGTRIAVDHREPARSLTFDLVELSLQAPSNAIHATIGVYGSQGTSGTSYYDDVSLVAAPGGYTAALGAKRELFADDYRIESATDVERVVHPATKRGAPLIVADRPWETSVYIYGSVLTDIPGAPKYQMWYTCFWDNPVVNQPDVYYLCYATSADGITWAKPNVNQIAFNGSTANNIVGEWGGTVAYNPTEPVATRYRMLAFKPNPPEEILGYYAYHSSDGKAWTQSSPDPVLPYGDVSNVIYNPDIDRYIATTKQRTVNIATIPGTNDRMAWVSTSEDFLSWSASRLAVESDARDDAAAMGRGGIEGQIYGMPVYPYESTYLAFPWMFEVSGNRTAAGDGPIYAQLASSRDLVRWSRPERDPVLPLGRAGAWDDGMLFTSTTLHTSADRVSVYYGAFRFDHGGGVGQTASIGLASWRRDGFVSLYNGGDDPGTVVTRPFTFTGGTLHLNTVVGTGGGVKVEVLPATGTTPIAGFTVNQANTITGDQLDATSSWAQPLSTLAGQQVRLKFHIDNADLYSYWIS